MLDVSVSYNRFKFIGYEFLSWLWYVIENDDGLLKRIDPQLVSFDIGNRIVFENFRNDTQESITIKGDEANLAEGMIALGKGAYVTEVNLTYISGDHRWNFSIKGESLTFTGLKTPETGPVESNEDIEGVVLEKIYLVEKAVTFIHELYRVFIKKRVSMEWDKKTVPLVNKWILAKT
jgi:hypothetical protein